MGYFVISFLLSGKFASWRDPSTVAAAKSYLYPSNTNIIGILGAALGISKEEKLITEVQNKIYGIGVQGVFDKKSFTDKRLFLERLYNYSHLEPNRIRTIQTWEYIINPKYKIIVVTKFKEFAKKLKFYLENPEYPIYLGRSEFIGKIKNVKLEENVNLEQGKKIVTSTHIVYNVGVSLTVEPGTILYITKKLRKYYTTRKLYNQGLLVDVYEIIGEATVGGKIETYKNIPLMKI